MILQKLAKAKNAGLKLLLSPSRLMRKLVRVIFTKKVKGSAETDIIMTAKGFAIPVHDGQVWRVLQRGCAKTCNFLKF